MTDKIKYIILVPFLLVLLYAGYSRITDITKISDSKFESGASYLCVDKKSFTTSFRDDLVRVKMSDGRVFTLEKVSEDTSGVKYADEKGDYVLSLVDLNGFFQEGSTETYRACRT